MGIDGLSKLIAQKAPKSIKTNDIKTYFGRRVAVDASCTIYQCLIAMKGFSEGQNVELTNANGEITSHLQGIWSRTIRMVADGLKPIYVFDGTPPDMKAGELAERRAKAAVAQQQLAEAKEAHDDEAMERLSKRTVRVSKEQTAECIKLLRLMGIPVVQAAGEAEAQCVELCRGGKAWAVATEDMDALTFGAPVMLRHLNYSSASHPEGITEYRIEDLLKELGMTKEQFTDMCILLGCDYTSKIYGVGPHRAFEGIKQHGTIEKFIASLDAAKYPVPDDFNFAGARDLFFTPKVTPSAEIDIVFGPPDVEGLKEFLVRNKCFGDDRVEKGIKKLQDARATKTQGRLDSFFKVVGTVSSSTGPAKKRGKENEAALPSGKLAKTGQAGGKKGVKK